MVIGLVHCGVKILCYDDDDDSAESFFFFFFPAIGLYGGSVLTRLTSREKSEFLSGEKEREIERENERETDREKDVTAPTRTGLLTRVCFVADAAKLVCRRLQT